MQYYYYYYYYMLIIDPSDCQSPSTMVDYCSCAMYLSRYYVCLYWASREGCGAPSATSATGSAVISLQESRKLLSPVDQRGGVTTWQWCQEFTPALQGKSLTCNRIPETVRGVFTGSQQHRRQSDTPDYQNQLVDCSALVVSEIIWLENQPYQYDKARLIL